MYGYEMELVIRLVLAAFFGWLIGLERETLGKTAGTRTFALVSVGAALFALVSDGGAQQVAVGIGFLGAGLIMHKEGRVEGLTTAAALWAAAGLGMILGQGYILVGTIATILILAITYLLRFLHPESWRK